MWQARFCNQNVRVASLAPTHVPGPVPQRSLHVAPDGRLGVDASYVVASDAHTFVGAPVAHNGRGLTLWRLDGAPRLATVRSGIQPNGDMTEPGVVRAYDCAGGRLELTLIPKSTSDVTLELDGKVVQTAHIGGRDFWNGTVFAPAAPSPRACTFRIVGQSLLGSTRVAFVPSGS